MAEAEDKKLSGRQALIAVLKRAKGEPLPAKEIVKKALAMKGLALTGKTPEATLRAVLSSESKRPDGEIKKAGKPGMYRLRERGGS